MNTLKTNINTDKKMPLKATILSIVTLLSLNSLSPLAIAEDESSLADKTDTVKTDTRKMVRKAKRKIRNATGNESNIKDAKDHVNDAKDDLQDIKNKRDRKIESYKNEEKKGD